MNTVKWKCHLKKTQDDSNEKPPSTWTSAEVNWLKVTAWFKISFFPFFSWFEFHCEFCERQWLSEQNPSLGNCRRNKKTSCFFYLYIHCNRRSQLPPDELILKIMLGGSLRWHWQLNYTCGNERDRAGEMNLPDTSQPISLINNGTAV